MRHYFITGLLLLMLLATASRAATRLTLKNGMVFEGKFSSIASIAENPLARNVPAGGVALKPVVIVDDELRRTYFPKRQLLSLTESGTDDTPVRIEQRVTNTGSRVGSVGAILSATPFNEYGRRAVTVMTASGTQKVVQGITEISPIYTRVQCCDGSMNWDMRIATSSIPSDTLRQILLRNDRKSGADAHRDVVRLLFQAERFQDAAKELQLAMKQFPELKELESLNQQLIQRGAQLLLTELEHRKQAGQHRYVSTLLKGFPNQNVATENLIRAAELLKEYETAAQQGERVLTLLKPLVEEVEDAPRRKLIDQLFAEISSDLSVNNLHRMADFLRLADDQSLTSEERLSLAVSGWLLGQGEGLRNLAVTSSLLDVRGLVREYMRAMGVENQEARRELVGRIADLEGGTPAYVAKLLAAMKPPHDLPAPTEIPGFFRVEVPGTDDDFAIRYRVQLPPEYDPYVRYPAIVTMHAAGSTGEAQIEWWAGEYDDRLQTRRGQASRHGYIVVAPEWTNDRQSTYEYTAREHHVVTASLRDAMRRFSIDSDRVFLSGHALGADAAWDIAVAHPDTWAGMVLIGGRANYGKDAPQYVNLYWDYNPRGLSMYFVFGELDGNKLADNSNPLNRYMGRAGFDPVVVQYQGRGNEHFYEEIQRIFQWMQPLKRDFFPDEFETVSMRPWDNYFWYADLQNFPSVSMVSPLGWPPDKTRPCRTRGTFGNNRVSIRTGASKATVWLSPDIVNFDEPIRVKVNSEEQRDEITPDLETMLEDARQRADRQHVFWAKVTLGVEQR
jgi:pimeloyl-ACP methyl ester carboxylesterase